MITTVNILVGKVALISRVVNSNKIKGSFLLPLIEETTIENKVHFLYFWIHVFLLFFNRATILISMYTILRTPHLSLVMLATVSSNH